MSNPSFDLLQGDPTTWGIPPTGKTFIGINTAGQLVLKQNDGTISTIVSSAPALSQLTNSSGSTTISISAQVQTASVAIIGGARTVPVIVSDLGASAGAVIDVFILFPAVAGIILDLRDGSGSGVQLDQFNTDGSVVSGIWRLYFDGTNWQKKQVQVPAY